MAFALSMDTFAVSLSCGMSAGGVKIKDALRAASFFCFFQMLMPVIGWFAGLKVRGFIALFDHWAAFGLLALVGGKMIYESFQQEECEKRNNSLEAGASNRWGAGRLIALSIATSIDALAVGLTFSFLKISIIRPLVIIGIVTFLTAFSGFFFGNKSGHFLGKKAEAGGGIVLILIGVKILLEGI